jgi:hypothetical protein
MVKRRTDAECPAAMEKRQNLNFLLSQIVLGIVDKGYSLGRRRARKKNGTRPAPRALFS